VRANPLSDRVPRALPEILRSAENGDWRLRAACLSEAGRIARSESTISRAIGWGMRRLPGVRETQSAGFHGRYVRGPISNGLVDRSWPVRVAAALALGDCRSPTEIPALETLLSGHYRPERIAAAAAILSCGGTVKLNAASLVEGALPVPEFVGDSSPSIDVLKALATAHPEVLGQWRSLGVDPQPRDPSPAAWAEFLAGPRGTGPSSSLQAEIDRYDADNDAEYVLTKPLSAINRLQNTRLLHTFAAVCEQLQVPANARVLDLGGGSAWVSQLLAQLGYTPITVDVSTALLTVGQRRFATHGLTPRFVAADMTRLPVASGSVAAVVVIDALHHVPNIPGVFEEAFRVLEAGGAFVLAEPGEGHSEMEKSRAEMLEFGVHEREIHLLEVFDYAQRAGFDDVRAVPNPVPKVGMTRDQLVNATSSSADRWMVVNDDRPGYFAPYVIQSIFGHPILVCRKGRRAFDSLMPGLLRAEILPQLSRAAQRVTGRARVRNIGDTLWLAGQDLGHVRLGIQLLSSNRTQLALDFVRVALPSNLAPGGTAELPIDLELPDATSPYVLKLDLVDEGVAWFQDTGSQPVYVAV